MDRKIHKYVLPLEDHSRALMPVGAEVLSAHEQDDKVCVWALIDPAQNQNQTRTFVIVGTGATMEYHDQLRFIDTVHLYEGSLVLHVFEFRR